MTVDAEGGKPLLGVGGEDGGKVHRARALRPVEAPDGLDGVRVHVHRLASVAPAGGDGDGDGDTFPGEFLGTGGGFGHATDGGVRDDALDGGAVGIAEFRAQEVCDGDGHPHRLVFQGFPDAVHPSVDGGADADFGISAHIVCV